MQLTTDGIVLRDYKIEEDRILQILTQRQGVLTAFANGANRTRSRLASSTELLCYSRFVFFKNKERYVVDKADSNRIFFGIREDLDKLALASYCAELAGELSPKEEPAEEYLRLLLNCLHCVEADLRPAVQIKALLELRLLTLAGYMPNLVACRVCGEYERPLMFFLPQQGELCCESCHRSGEAAAFPVGPGVLAAMRHIIYAPFEKLFSFSLSDEGLLQLEQLSEYYLKCQVEKTFRSLEFYNSLRRMRPPSDGDLPNCHGLQS